MYNRAAMTHHSSRIAETTGLILAVLVAVLVCPASTDAQVRKIVIEKKVSPAFDGRSFGMRPGVVPRVQQDVDDDAGGEVDVLRLGLRAFVTREGHGASSAQCGAAEDESPTRWLPSVTNGPAPPRG